MSFMQKLCDVYDDIIDTSATEGDAPLLPLGFTQKNIAINVILSPVGEFVTAQRLAEEGSTFAIPSTPQAESRSSDATPFPLADSLKYLMSSEHGGYLDKYLSQLAAWCAATHAPECLRVLLNYLQKQTLYEDLSGVAGLKLQFDKGGKPGKGKDATQIVCFSVEYADEENRLWMREDVKRSWRSQIMTALGADTALCYVTGKRLPEMKKQPYLQVTARLISSKDEGFPFQYKGRFVEDGSAATISIEASIKLHRALRWLLAHQSFRKYGMSFVGWNTRKPRLKWSTVEEDEGEGEAKPAPNTLQDYVMALFDSVQGRDEALQRVTDPENTTAEALQRQEEIVLLGLQCATNGRVSVTYEQEIPGNVFVEHVNRWNAGCRWLMKDPKQPLTERPVTWLEICEAVMGMNSFQATWRDFKADKSATKYLRDLQLRLLHCVVEAQPIPENMVSAAFNRAVQPLSFTDSKGNWNVWKWQSCMATACAMIRKLYLDRKPSRTVSPTLDTTCTERDYLYGRLLALAHYMDPNTPSHAMRMMTHFVQQPKKAWQQLYLKLLPYLKTLGKDGYSARYDKHLLAQAESLFTSEDIDNGKPLSYLFLVGFNAQTNDLWAPKEQKQKQTPRTGYLPPKTRDELYGCLLAMADHYEWLCERQEDEAGRSVSRRDGRTNAMQLTAAFMMQPMTTWAKVHDKLIPYLEKMGVETADSVQRLLRKTEQSFTPEERLSDAPLGRGFLHGYLMMLEALQSRDGLDTDGWQPAHIELAALPATREAAYGALLALENQTERRILDLDKSEEENRPSNAMRFMARAAQRPNEVWAYLQVRMRPYANKYWFTKGSFHQAEKLQAWIEENHWNHDKPLGAEYLYDFYLYNQFDNRKDD